MWSNAVPCKGLLWPSCVLKAGGVELVLVGLWCVGGLWGEDWWWRQWGTAVAAGRAEAAPAAGAGGAIVTITLR